MLDGLTFDQIRMFVVVADAGSFRAGASSLSRAQSAVSRAIANLEDQLKVKLFDRSAHRPVLTPAGRALLADARSVLMKVDFLRARARGLGEGIELGVAIAVDCWFPMPVVETALKELRDAYPSVAVRLSTAPLGGPIAALLEKRCALAVTVSEDFRDPQIQFHALATVPVVTVAAANHPIIRRGKLKGQTVNSAELAEHLQIVLEDPTRLSADHEFGVASATTWRVTEQETKHALIRAAIGWGRLPLWLVARDLAERRLARIPAATIGPGGEIIRNAYLAHRNDYPLGPAARVIRDALIRHSQPTRREPGRRRSASK
jgi:DNA-binding transcriptional LysR family regulator